jgi:hypothetical protein
MLDARPRLPAGGRASASVRSLSRRPMPMTLPDPAVPQPPTAPGDPPPGRATVAVVAVESPHVVRYTLYLRRPGDEDFAKAAAGTQPGGRHALGELPAATEVGGVFVIAGGPNTAYRIAFDCEVDGTPVPGTEPVSGTTDANGADARRVIVRLP